MSVMTSSPLPSMLTSFAYFAASGTSTVAVAMCTINVITVGVIIVGVISCLSLQRLAAQDESTSQLPNFVYSTLLADFRESTGHTASKQGKGSGFAPAAVPTSPEEEVDGEMSLESRLSQAVMMYPVVVVRLMDK